MRTLKIDVSDSIYEHIIFFLKSLPTHLIRISDAKEDGLNQKNTIKNQLKDLLENTNIKTFQDIDDSVAWQQSMRDEWK